jgi:large subunit ribosomal protein L25
VSLEVEATHIPENIVVNIEGAEDGTKITAGDLTLPAGASLLSDPEMLIVGVTTPGEVDLGETEETEGDETAEGEEAAADADGESSGEAAAEASE